MRLPASLRLTSSAALAWSSVLLVQEILLLLFFIAGTHGMIVPLHSAATTDFASFYAAGMLADQGTPALAYDMAAHFAAERQAVDPGIQYVFFFYPPMFLMICALLAWLPYLVAFLGFQAVSLALYLGIMRRILGTQGWGWLVPVLAFPPVLISLGFGQNSLLTAFLLGSTTLLLEKRPVTAGAAIGALCYKPHFGLLVPLALAARGQWRAFAAAAGMGIALMALSLALFGQDTWVAYLSAFAGSHRIYESGRIDFPAFITPFGASRLIGLSLRIAYAVQTIVSLACAAIVVWVWRRRTRAAVRYCVLVSATFLAVPLAIFYDLVGLSIAMAWLIRDGQDKPLASWEKACLPVIYAASLAVRSAGTAAHLPVGFVPALLLLIIGVRRAMKA
jgi:hypothetical protein